MKGDVTKLAMQFRSEAIERSAIDAEKRTIDLAFSSEYPVERWWGTEILSHDPGACDLSRMNGGAAVLVNHDSNQHIGVVESARIDPVTKKGRALVRFGKSAMAEEKFQAAQDGILRHVSVGYRINRIETMKDGNGENEVDRVTSWEPVEVSLVAVPADPTVGVGRTVEKEFPVVVHRTLPVNPVQEQTTMANETAVVDVNKEREQAREQETARVRNISSLCKTKAFARGIKEGQEAKWIAEGTSEADVRKAILDQMVEQTQTVRTVPTVDLTEKEAKKFSLSRLIQHIVARAEGTSGPDASFELEVSAAAEKRYPSQRGGIVLPTDLPMAESRVGLVTSSNAAGGYSVQTTLQSLIELLRNRMVVRQAGATVLAGLSDTLAFPKQLTPGTANWVAENPGSDNTDADITLGQITMTPKMLTSSSSYSRKLLAQSSLDIEALVRNDLIMINAIALDLAALNGSGASNQPTGILNTSNVNAITFAANGGAPTYADFVAMETLIAGANADIGEMAYVITPEVRGFGKRTVKVAGQILGTIVETDGSINGYRAFVTNQLPKLLTRGSATDCHAGVFGVWSGLMIGEWGSIELIVDPYRLKKQGMVEIASYLMADIAVRYPVAFSLSKYWSAATL